MAGSKFRQGSSAILDLCNYYRQFVHKFSELASPLIRITRNWMCVLFSIAADVEWITGIWTSHTVKYSIIGVCVCALFYNKIIMKLRKRHNKCCNILL